MTISGRQRSVPSSNSKTRRQDFKRRALWAESLEPRAMMDGNGLALTRYPFWNIQKPTDVNADGRVSAFDALAIINELNLRGARSLATQGPATSAGEDPAAAGTGFIDVNNDNRVSAMDALQVINRLNLSGGEGEPLVRLTVQIVAAGTNDDLATISRGGFYEMRVLTEDLGILTYMSQTRPSQDANANTLLGVATTFFDVTYDTTKTDVQTNDNQIVFITGSPTNNGTFTLTVNDNGTLKTTAPITFAANRVTTGGNIQTALNTLLKPNTDSPDVVEVTHEPSGGNNRWRVRFINKLGSQDVPEMTGNVSGLGTATLSISEAISGETTNPIAYSDALALRTRFDADGNALNDDPTFFPDQRGGSRASFGINDLGGSQFLSPYQGTAPTEIARIHMDAKQAGTVNYTISLQDVLAGLETGLQGFGVPITTDLITVVGDSLTITAPLTAGADSGNVTEGSAASIDINVLSNDVNNAPTPDTAKSLVSINTTGLVGSAQIVTVGGVQQIRYTPPGAGSDFNGPTTLTYVVTDQNSNTDTGTVTINIGAVNDTPTVNTVAPQNINEDTARIFNGINGNQILLNDVDNPAGPMTLTLSVTGGGALTLGSTADLTGTVGNGTSSITTNGTLQNLNAALDGLSYLAAQNSSGTFNLTVAVNDNGQTGTGGSLQGSRVIVLNVAAVNDAPVVELGGFTVTPDVVEGDPLVLNAANNTLIQVSDIDSPTVTVTLAVAAGNTLQVNPAPGVTIGTNNTNSVTLSGSVSSVNGVLANGVTFTPALGATSTDTLQISVNDGTAPTVTASRTIEIDPATRPRARNDALTVVEDSLAGTANTVDVLDDDIVNVPDPTVYVAELISFDTTSINGGTIMRDDGGTPGVFSDDKLIYVPAPDFFGTDTFTYTMNDTKAGSVASVGTVNVTVTAVNDKPVAQNDPLSSVSEDSAAFTILASSLTGNDSRGAANESAQILTIVSVGNAVGGTVSINGSGNVVFTPTADFNGAASFTYTVQDNGQTNGVNDFKTSDPATVSFTITEVNDTPTAPNQVLASVAEDTASVTIPFATLLTGATAGAANEGAQALTISAVSAPIGGTVAISGTDVIFTPTANFNGNASFTFTVSDNGTTNGGSDAKSTNATASFTITASNDAPTAAPDTGMTGEAQVVDIPVRNNDFDVDVAPFTGTPGQLQAGTTIVNISNPTDGITTVGTAVVQGTGIRFTPNAGFFGTATFTYQLNDGTGAGNALSAPATVTVTVVEANDPPVANPDPNIVVNEDDQNFFIDVFANDTDPDTAKAGWSFILISGPAHGTATFDTASRTVKYVPAADYNGSDQFTYQINDNDPIDPIDSHLSNMALVSITVREVNDAPVGGVDPAIGEFTVIKDREKTFTTAELLANDSAGPANESSQTFSITAVTPASDQGGTVTLVGGVITYTPAVGFLGSDYFEYTLTDNGTTAGSADPKSVQVRVNLLVRDFIPTDLNGFVFRDVNNNGTYQAGVDFPLSGVEVTLSGTSEVSGAITPITVETDHTGFYQFLAVEPGDYHLTQAQPVGLADGPETLGQAASFFANDDIFLDLPQFGLTGGVSTNNFAEGGIDASKLINAAGLVSESLSSSSPNGMVLATTLVGGLDLWSWKLQGWTNATDMQVTLDADKTAATLVVNGFSLRIFQNPNDIRNANRFNADPVARLARFRILGWDANGNYMIRLDGTASDFYGVGHALAAAPAPLAGGEYVDGVDAAMAEESWA